MIATYKESREVLEPTIQSVIDSDYDKKKIILILAYEERGGPEVEKLAHELIYKYKNRFMYAEAIKHPKDIPGEVIGKGGNITYAGRILQKYLEKEKIDPLRVIVTTLDADNHPHPYYFAALSYIYALCPEPKYISFQPIPMYTNNIWDAPAPMRVVATGNSFWNIVLALRPHMLRNFSSHAQSMQTLIDTDFWSVRTIVEDGHQFWRTYFRYNGRHQVYPIYIPIYQDAVFSDKYTKTLKAQFIQLRRWAWGASDIAYVADNGFFKENDIPKRDVIFKFFRLLEGHITWAVAPMLLAFSAFVPLLFNPKSYAANQLPIIASRIETLALLGIFATLFLSLKTLPPKPKRYKARRSFFMIIQWVYLPVTTVLYNSLSAIYSQTRLMFGKYIESFDFTEKAVVTADKKKVL
jgi:cellulose synthase/poly-beta-1,6-N-acetylglucosamine synthase-like glycosyltransferase